MSDNDTIEILGEQSSNLNSVQIEEARAYLSSIGNFCGANSDGNIGCHKTVEALETLWKASVIQRNIPIPERIHPFLVVNEKQGRGLHRLVNGVREYCGNVNYFCKSCNMVYNRRTISDIKPDEKSTYQSRKSHEVRPKFRTKIKRHLMTHTHACYAEIMNKWSGDPDFKSTQETLENAYKQEFDVTLDEIDIAEYGIECEYKKCNGTHIIIKGEPPMVGLTKADVDKFISEKLSKTES